MAIYDDGLMKKMTRLRGLLASGSTVTEVQKEISDLKVDILGSGVSEAELEERTAPGVSGF